MQKGYPPGLPFLLSTIKKHAINPFSREFFIIHAYREIFATGVLHFS